MRPTVLFFCLDGYHPFPFVFDIDCRVVVPVMAGEAFLTGPFPIGKRQFRVLPAADMAELAGRKLLVDLDKVFPLFRKLIFQKCAEHAKAVVTHRFAKAELSAHGPHVQILH